MRRFFERAAACAALLTIASCGKLDRVTECKALARIVNPELDGIEQAVRVPSARAYRDAAKGYTRLLDELRKQKPGSPMAQQHNLEYADLISEVPGALERYATALETKDAAELSASADELERIGRRERALVARRGAYCSGR